MTDQDGRKDVLGPDELEHKRRELEELEETLKAKKSAIEALERHSNEVLRVAEETLGKKIEVPEVVRTERPRFNLSWLRYEDIVAELSEYINVVEDKKFSAFSMPNGKVYVQAKLVDLVIRKLALRNGQSEIAEMSERSHMRRMMIATVNILKSHGAVDENEIPRNYYGRHYSLNWYGGNQIRMFYLPINASVFGNIQDLESSKPEKLLDIESVLPEPL